jgi:hypothetical protein
MPALTGQGLSLLTSRQAHRTPGMPGSQTGQAILQGEFHISGFRNQSLRHYLPKPSSAQISCLLKGLRVHGLIKSRACPTPCLRRV